MFAIRKSSLPTATRRTTRLGPGAVLAGLASASLLLAACGSGGPAPGTGAPAPTTSPATTAPSTAPSTPGSTSPSTRAPRPPSTTTQAPSAATRVISYRISYPWNWPNDVTTPGSVAHRTKVPPVPELVRLAAGHHPATAAEVGYDRMTFTFTHGFPSYRFSYSDLTADGSGHPVPVKGLGTLVITFTGAQAHTSTSPVRSTIVAQPRRPLNLERLVDYAPAGDFEGVLTYGLGITWLIPKSNPQIPVRVIEQEAVTSAGTHLYVVAVDLRLGNSMWPDDSD